MKIDNTKGVSLTRGVAEKSAIRKSKKRDATDFVSNVPTNRGGDEIETVEDTAGLVGSSGGVAGLEALIAVQEVSFQNENYRSDVDWGKNMLSYLEQLRNSLLKGAVPEEYLESIMEQVGEHKRRHADKQLDSVLDEIELRASVELAKLGKGNNQ